ncbi:MAG TPA: methyltransferase domain-containing protein [Desulfobacterales bacterium]|nr:methyltransferase domain-containing protein [Desulfobacterales bacterium]HIP37839.1 methyltransferase domain-containing protein [Desulfocapsa sulfexigens]
MVLDLDKEKIARCFRRSLPTYDDAALVQNKLAVRLLESVDIIPDSAYKRVLEIGCGTGLLTEMLCRNKPIKTLYLNDLVSDFESVVFKRTADQKSIQFVSCFGDIESLDFPQDLSLVISGSTFQWLSNLPEFFEQLGRKFPSGAYLAFSLFGPGTLKEFSSLTAVELGYCSNKKIVTLLEQDFILESHNEFQDILYFRSVKELLYHIRATGVGGVSEYQWTRESLRQFEVRYCEEFGAEKGLPVSYSSSCFVLRRR